VATFPAPTNRDDERDARLEGGRERRGPAALADAEDPDAGDVGTRGEERHRRRRIARGHVQVRRLDVRAADSPTPRLS
jgi:hypothetical protein